MFYPFLLELDLVTLDLNYRLLIEGKGYYQGSYRSWKTWKVMEFMILISRPGKSWNFSEGHGKLWKSNMLLDNKKAKR